MKKYKLIKEYPGSDHEGIIVSLKTPNGLYEGYQHNYYTKHVENNPEYWEEVIEKDYEILSFKQDSSITDLWTKFTGGWSRNINGYPVTGPYTLEDILKNNLYKIHSVKRLSDGEVFTVGDRAKVYEYGSVKTIDSIDLVTKCSSMKQGIWLNYNSGSSHITHAIKQIKQPIFLTHDGKDIFEEDKVWYVNKENLYYDHIIAFPEVKFNSEIRAYFLTREGAEDYIEKNKVLFTTEDGVSIKRGDTIHTVQSSLDGIDRIMVVNFRPKDYPTLKVFSTRAAAENYIERNKPQLSIEDCFKILQKSFLYGNGFEKEIEKYIRKNNR